MKSFLDLLIERAARTPDRLLYTFLKDGGEEAAHLTFGELDRRARTIGAELQRQGLTGERALLLFPPGLDFITAFFGCMAGGTLPVPAYPPHTRRIDPRLSALVADAAPRAVLTTPSLRARQETLTAAHPELRNAVWISLDEIDPARSADWRHPGAGPEDLAFLQYTSGSTSAPRGVEVIHGNLLANEEMIRQAFGMSESSVVVGWLPLYHDMGLIGNVLQPLFSGGRCILMSPLAFLQRPARWLQAIHRYRATVSGGPDFAYELCVRKVGPEERVELDLSSWEVAFSGAEPVRAATLDRFCEAFAPQGFRRSSLYPCYGLAEATLFVSGGAAGAGPRVASFAPAFLESGRAEPPSPSGPQRALVSCGHAWQGQEIAIADPRTRQRCATGHIGEIWVAGPSIARGYWRRPEVTESDFRAVLAGEPAAGPFLRTGDLGFIEGGELFVTGRLKDLIILRGRNCHPQDVEQTAERAAPSIRPGCVAAFGVEREGEERLVVVAEIDLHPSLPPADIAEAIRRAVAEEHEAQPQEVALIRAGTLPRTSSGKVRRHACRAAWLEGQLDAIARSLLARDGREAETGSAAASAVPRREELLGWLRHEASRVARLPPERLPVDEPLSRVFDSLGAAELRSALQAGLGVEIPLSRLLEGIDLREVAREVLERLERNETREEPAPVPAGEAPLSFGQQSLWFLHRLAPESGAYHIVAAARALSPLSPATLRRALDSLAARHPQLRATFPADADGPRQRIDPELRPELVEIDAAGFSAEGCREIALREAYRPFDLSAGPLLRIALLRGAPGGDLLVWAIHHIVADFWTMALLVRELGALYGEAADGTAGALPPPAATYESFARRQAGRIAGPEGERLWSFWQRTLAGAPFDLELPTDHPRPAERSWRGASNLALLEAGLAEGAEALAQSRNATLFMVLLAAFQTLLSRVTGQDDLLIGTPTAGRERPELAGVAGYFVNPVVLRGDLGGDPSFAELLDRTRRTTLEALEHRELPFPLLIERLRPDRVAASTPVIQAALALQKAPRPEEQPLAAFALGAPGARARLGALHLESFPLPERFSPFDLVLRAARLADGLALSLQYDSDLFDATTAQRLLEHLKGLLAAVVADPERRLEDLPLLSEAERFQVMVEWPEARRPYPRESGLVELFGEQVRQAPEAVAVEQGSLQMTRAELNARSSQLARWLRDHGVGPESRVGLCLERSPELIVSILAVVKAGGTYVPLDASYPQERLAFLLEDSGAEVLIADERLAALLPRGNRPVLPPHPPTGLPAAEGLPQPSAGPDSLAYIMYTSGSTGRPKGVAIPQRGIVRLVRNAEYCDLGPDQVFLQHAPTSFDASTLEIWAPLLNGGRLVLAPPGRLSLDELVPLLQHHGVTTLWLTTSQFHQLAENHLDALGPLRQIVLGGDVVLPEAFRRTLAARPGLLLVHCYGPTESTTFSSTHPLRSAEEVTAPVPIGRPISNTSIVLLDDALRPVPVGTPGELYVGGDGLARGYVGRPDLTAERFVPDPSGREPGARLYRTGDRARWRLDGLVEFLGRRDRQVKIRGFRVEPGEIEAALRACPGVEQAVVVVHGGPGERRLVAWVAAPQGGVDAAGLRASLRRRLPEFMVPEAIGIEPSLPLGPTGKLDRSALARREPLREKAAGEAPRTPLEELLGEIFADVLGVPAVGRDDSFFDLGGHSLLAARVVSRLQEAAGCALRLQELFEAPTLAALARMIETRRGGPALPPLSPVDRRQRLPVSPAQERLWLVDRLYPGDPAYHIPAAIHLGGPLSIPVLHAALSAVVARHEALRTHFAEQDGAPVQIISLPAEPSMPVVDLAALPSAEGREEASRLARAEAQRSFDLETGSLLRTLLLDLGGGEHELVLVLHHIIFDGWSLALFVRELGTLYTACRSGAAPQLPPLPVQPADHAAWQRQWLATGAREELVRFWENEMRGALPEIDLPADRPRTAGGERPGGKRETVFSAALTAEIRRLGRRRSSTPFMTLLTGFAALLYRFTGERDLTVGTPVAGRDHRDIEELIGFFVNTLALRVRPDGGQPFAALLAQVREVTLRALDHQGLPFSELVEHLRPDRDAQRNPLFNVMFILQSGPSARLELPGLTVHGREIASGVAKFDLTLILEEAAGALVCAFEHDAGRFDATTIQRLAEAYVRLLTGATAQEELPVRDLPLLSEAEQHQLRIELDATDLGSPGSLHHLFAAAARRQPEAEAVRCAGQTRLYGELHAAAGRLAQALHRAGVDVGSTVGLLFPTGHALIEALLGTLAAGAAFAVVDPGQPPERIEQILRAARPVLLLGDGNSLAATLPLLRPLREQSGLRLVCLGDTSGELAAEPGLAVWDAARLSGLPDRFPETTAGPDDPAYLVFTSGSTGQPKGILQTHGSFVQFLAWQARQFSILPPARVAQWAATTYDASYCEIFGTLCFGATLVLAPPEQRYDSALALEWLEAEQVTLLQVVPSFARHLLEALDAAAADRPEPPLRRIEWILLAGEPLPVDLAAAWRKRCPGARLFNLFGPTESVLATFHEVGEADLERPSIPIGQAIEGRHLLVVDADGQPAPPGARGEIWIRSPFLTCGYPGRPAETAAAFVPDPEGAPDVRCYRTGDLGRLRGDGVLELLGRRDFQMKIRGVRVEVEEIEAVLRRHEEIRDCAVAAREIGPGDLRLVAYVVTPGEPEAATWTAWLARRLPAAMIPAIWLRVDELPRNVNGKLDRSRLPVPDRAALSLEAGYVAPRTPTEAELAAIFAELLRIERIGVQDSFFAAGGHSLLATRALARIRAKFGVSLPLRAFFDNPTVAALAATVAEQRAAALTADQMAHLIERLEGLSDEEVRRLLAEAPQPFEPSH